MKVTIYVPKGDGRFHRVARKEWKHPVGAAGTVFCPVIPDGLKRVDRGANCVPCRASEYALLTQVKYLHTPKTERQMGRKGWYRLWKKFRTCWDKPSWAVFSHERETNTSRGGQEVIPYGSLKGAPLPLP